MLTLPKIDPAPLQAAASLGELGALIGQQLGVSKVHLVKTADSSKLEVEINPRSDRILI